jgi:hypothetical protein
MRVSVKRSGGFAGMTHARAVDSSTLDPHDAETLADLVRHARAAAVPEPRMLPDAYMYEVDIDGVEQTIREPDAPREWSRLIEWVLAR